MGFMVKFLVMITALAVVTLVVHNVVFIRSLRPTSLRPDLVGLLQAAALAVTQGEGGRTRKGPGALSPGVTTTPGQIGSGVVSGRVTRMGPGGDGGGLGENRTMAAAMAIDLVDHDQNVVPSHLSTKDRKAPEADGRDGASRRRDSAGQCGAGGDGGEDVSTTSAEEEPHDPWMEAKRRQAPASKQMPQRDPWEGYTRQPEARDAVWEGWQHFDYAGGSDREAERSQAGAGGGSRPIERLTVPTFSGEDDGDDVGTSARSYLRQIEAWRRMRSKAWCSTRTLLERHGWRQRS